MNLHKFFPVQEPQPEEFDEAFLDTALNAVNRFSMVLQPGIIPAASMYAITGDNRFSQLGEFACTVIPGATGDVDPFILNIGSGMAFSRNPVSDPTELPYDPANSTDLKMERIFINPTELVQYDSLNPTKVDSVGNLLPRSTGSLGIQLNPRAYLPDGPRALSKTYYIYVAQMAVVDTLTVPGGDPVNKYSIDPFTGQVSYTHWVDGYKIRVYDGAPSADTDDIYLATVQCTNVGITTIDTSGRTYAYVPSAIIRGKIGAALLTSNYTYETFVSLTEHLNAVGDPALVTASNPHGLSLQLLPGSTAGGPYIDTPENMHANGIADVSGANPGPFFSVDTARPDHLARTAKLLKPTSNQTLYIYGKGYGSGARYWSEVANIGNTNLEMQELFEIGGDQILRADFPFGLRSAGYYFIYGEPHTGITGATATCMDIKALQVVGATGTALLVANPAAYLTPTQYPFAVCQFDGNNFTAQVDPQTGYTNTDYKMIDIRQFGTIGSNQLSNNKRCYPSDTTPHLDVIGISRNMSIAKNLAVGQTLTVGGTLSAGHLIGDGSGITNFPARAFGLASSSTNYVRSIDVWQDIVGMTVTLATHGGPLIMNWNAFCASGAPGARVAFRFVVDGVPVTVAPWGNVSMKATGSLVYVPVAASWITAVGAGSHTVKVQWVGSSATTTSYLSEFVNGTEYTLAVHEG
jgi:hypothetical protein